MIMEDKTVKARYILAALGISLILCAGITLFFWLAEKNSASDSGQALDQTERIESSVYYG